MNSFSNRDTNKQNRSYNAYSASIFNNIATDCMKMIKEDGKKRKYDNIEVLSDIALEAQAQVKRLTCLSHQSMRVHTDLRYLSYHNEIMKSIQMNTYHTELDAMKHLSNDSIKKLYTKLNNEFKRDISTTNNNSICDSGNSLSILQHESSDNNSVDITADTSAIPPTNIRNEEIIPQVTRFQEVNVAIDTYAKSTLPHKECDHHLPHIIMTYIETMNPPIIENYTFKINQTNMTKYLLIKDYIPGLKSSFTRALLKYRKGEIPPHYTWDHISKRGRKPLIPNDKVIDLISRFKRTFVGGRTCPRSVLKKWIIDAMKLERMKQNQSMNSLPDINDSTIAIYMDIITSHQFINIEKNVDGKTENRLVAEWSQRSTINFLTVSKMGFILS